MKKLFLGIAIIVSCVSISANAATIDFVAMPAGNVSTIGDVTFSLAGVGEMGAPVVDSNFGGGLWNSTDSASYPTNTILAAEFDTTASNISWTFDNEGSKSTTWTLFDIFDAVIATGFNSTTSGHILNDLTAFSNVKRIEWFNGGNNWLFSLGSISYDTDVSAVPVPAAAWLFGSALLGFFGFSRRKANA